MMNLQRPGLFVHYPQRYLKWIQKQEVAESRQRTQAQDDEFGDDVIIMSHCDWVKFNLN